MVQPITISSLIIERLIDYSPTSMKLLIVLFVLLCTAISVSPPIYDYAYHITFDQAYTINKTVYRVNGQQFYDPKNNKQRVDRVNGRYNAFCGSILPNVTTACQSITTQNKRWIVFPQRSQCCLCCDSAHGCGILSPDWLKDSEYQGQEKIVDTLYDKWSKDGVVGYNYLWTTVDEQIPRRLDQNGVHVTDYNTHSFHNQTVPFPDSTFALPTYCKVQSPANCPLESICGKFRKPMNKLII